MFNRKKKQIESLKNNIKLINEKRIELSSANFVYQSTIQSMEKKIDEIYEMLVQKERTKKITKEMSKIAMDNVKKAAKKLEEKKKEVKKNGK